ncbi:MAG: diacylglycerol/lipid kinase family protein [Halanaerobiaceae bacterium]
MGKMINYRVIFNPAAGNKNPEKLLRRIKEVFASCGNRVNYHVTTGPGDAVLAAEKAVRAGMEVIVAAGGDGTINEVVNGIAGTGAVLGVIPTGTGNDFARALGMPPGLEDSCRQILAGSTRTVDLGTVRGRKFINCAGVGFDADVARRTNRQRKYISGYWMYLLSVLEALMVYRTVSVKITLDGGKMLECSPMLVAVGIGTSYGGGIEIVPDSVMDDGLFDVCVIDEVKGPNTLRYLYRALQGRHTELARTEIYRSRCVKLEMNTELPYHVEGEVFKADTLKFTLEPEAMRVIIPG